MSIIYMTGMLDYCINKVMPCGEVCLTLFSLTIFFAGLVYHCVATVYGLLEMYWGDHSECIEIEMFKRITCTIYLIWFLYILLYIVVNITIYSRKKKIQSVDEQYIEMWLTYFIAYEWSAPLATSSWRSVDWPIFGGFFDGSLLASFL